MCLKIGTKYSSPDECCTLTVKLGACVTCVAVCVFMPCEARMMQKSSTSTPRHVAATEDGLGSSVL